MTSVIHRLRLGVFAGFLLAAGASYLLGQGGPPMFTDDPGTPGDGHWEINLAWTDQRSPGSTEFGLPLLDANYGLGDRLQLNYQVSWVVLRNAGDSTSEGPSDSQLAVKWRFYDGGEKGWQVSTYPRVTFLDPDSHSDRRGLADPSTTYFLPMEVVRDLGPVSVDVEVGRSFSTNPLDEGWRAGVCLGHEMCKGFELDGEVYAVTSAQADRSEVLINVGSRVDFSEHLTLLLAIGRDLHNALGPRVSLFTYVGLQIRL